MCNNHVMPLHGRYHLEFPHYLRGAGWSGGVWCTLHLSSLFCHLVHPGPHRCPALWPALCLQHLSGELVYICTSLHSLLTNCTIKIEIVTRLHICWELLYIIIFFSKLTLSMSCLSVIKLNVLSYNCKLTSSIFHHFFLACYPVHC